MYTLTVTRLLHPADSRALLEHAKLPSAGAGSGGLTEQAGLGSFLDKEDKNDD
jgi:hypothetical protein